MQNIQVGSADDAFKSWMIKTTDPNLLRISDRYFSYYYDFDNAFKNISNGDFAMLEGELFLQANIRTRFTNK